MAAHFTGHSLFHLLLEESKHVWAERVAFQHSTTTIDGAFHFSSSGTLFDFKAQELIFCFDKFKESMKGSAFLPFWGLNGERKPKFVKAWGWSRVEFRQTDEICQPRNIEVQCYRQICSRYWGQLFSSFLNFLIFLVGQWLVVQFRISTHVVGA